MFLAKSNGVKDQEGQIVEEGLCVSLFVGMDTLKEAYKALICLKFPQRNLYILQKERHTYFLAKPLYSDLFDWIDKNISDIKTSNNLFGLSFIIQVDNEKRIVSVRDILADEGNLKNSPCCLSDILTSRLESTIEALI